MPRNFEGANHPMEDRNQSVPLPRWLLFLALCGGIGLLFAGYRLHQQLKHPNVVFLVLDTLRYDHYAAKRNDRSHAGIAFGLTILFGLMVVNAQVYTWTQMGVAVNDGAFHTMFYAITGTMMLLLVSGLVYTAVAAFRYLGGRTKELEIVSASALYWYFLTVAFTAVWFVVYVQK